MADFTTGVIDLSIENTFDDINMGATDTMTFSNSGTGGETGKPINVLGDFKAISGAVITLRNGQNLTPGTVTVAGITRDLDAPTAGSGTAGTGGNRTGYGAGSNSGYGGDGGDSSHTDGYDGDQSINNYVGEANGGAGGTYAGGNGTAGTVVVWAGGSGGGACGTIGASSERVSFRVFGTVSIASGVIVNGAGTNGGSGGTGANGLYDGGGYSGAGGGGAGGDGGSGGKLIIYHVGAGADASTKNLSAGSAGGGGAGGTSAGGAQFYGTAGTVGTVGTAGAVELIETDMEPLVSTDLVRDIFSEQASVDGEVSNDGGDTITERGFVWATSADPTTADTKTTVSGETGEYEGDLIGLSEDTTNHTRAFATNSIGTSYGDDIEFKTIKSFIPQTITAN